MPDLDLQYKVLKWAEANRSSPDPKVPQTPQTRKADRLWQRGKEMGVVKNAGFIGDKEVIAIQPATDGYEIKSKGALQGQRAAAIGQGVTETAHSLANPAIWIGAAERGVRALFGSESGDSGLPESASFLEKAGKRLEKADERAVTPMFTAADISKAMTDYGGGEFGPEVAQHLENLPEKEQLYGGLAAMAPVIPGMAKGVLWDLPKAAVAGGRVGTEFLGRTIPALGRTMAKSELAKGKAFFDQLTVGGNAKVWSAIKQFPKEISSIMMRGKVDESTVGLTIGRVLQRIKGNLGSQVNRFKGKVKANKKPTIDTAAFRAEAKGILGEFTQDIKLTESTRQVPSKILAETGKPFQKLETVVTKSGGKVGLSGGDQAYVADVMSLIPKGKASPRDMLIAIGRIDDILAGEGAYTGTQKGISAALGKKMVDLRNVIKNTLRQDYPGWAEADDAYHLFLQNVSPHGKQDLIKAFTGDNRASMARNILNEVKDPMHQRLEGALDVGMPGIGKSMVNKRLGVTKAAQTLMRAPFQDAVADFTRNMINTWQMYGAALGYAVAPKLKAALAVGGAVIARAGGKKQTDVLKVLYHAQRAKNMTSTDRLLARDLQVLVSHFGPQVLKDFHGVVPATIQTKMTRIFMEPSDRKGKE